MSEPDRVTGRFADGELHIPEQILTKVQHRGSVQRGQDLRLKTLVLEDLLPFVRHKISLVHRRCAGVPAAIVKIRLKPTLEFQPGVVDFAIFPVALANGSRLSRFPLGSAGKLHDRPIRERDGQNGGELGLLSVEIAT